MNAFVLSKFAGEIASLFKVWMFHIALIIKFPLTNVTNVFFSMPTQDDFTLRSLPLKMNSRCNSLLCILYTPVFYSSFLEFSMKWNHRENSVLSLFSVKNEDFFLCTLSVFVSFFLSPSLFFYILSFFLSLSFVSFYSLFVSPCFTFLFSLTACSTVVC